VKEPTVPDLRTPQSICNLVHHFLSLRLGSFHKSYLQRLQSDLISPRSFERKKKKFDPAKAHSRINLPLPFPFDH
jgi:hypothetical protein